jgi:hypothetical protein
MNKKQVLIGLLFLLLLGPVGSTQAALFSENFNDAIGVVPIYTDAPYSEKWSSTNYYIGGAPTYNGWTFIDQAFVAESGGDRAILLNEAPHGSMSRSIGGFTKDTKYLLTFDHWGDNRPGAPGYQFSVSIGDTSNTILRTYILGGTGATESIYFTATGSSVTLSFLDDSLGQASPIIDNISISAVPIPAGVWLLGSALVGLVGLRKRLKR